MNQNNTETEVKIRVDSLVEIAARLDSAGATIAAPRILEQNLRLDAPDHSLSRARKVLRLRHDSRTRLTYKEDPPESGVNSDGISRRTEIEVDVSDLNKMRLILEKIGYQSMWTYEKYRTTYTFMDCEIVLDELPFGMFIEIEGTPDGIESVLKTLALEHAPRLLESYSGLFIKLKQQMGFTFNDLTFANFEGVHVQWKD